MILKSEHIGAKLCRAMGLDPSHVQKITIELEADSLAIVTVEKMMINPEATELLTTIEQFRLVSCSFRLLNKKPASDSRLNILSIGAWRLEVASVFSMRFESL